MSRSGMDVLISLADSIELKMGLIASGSGSEERGCSWDKPGDALQTMATVFTTACRCMHGAATRITLLFKSPGLAEFDAVTSICNEIESTAEHISGVASTTLRVGAMTCLADEFASDSRRVLRAMLDLLRSIATSEEGRWNMLTGAVWEACNAAEGVRRTNKDCARRVALSWSLEIKDTVDEFVGLLEESRPREHGEIEEWEGFGDESPTYERKEEMQVVEGVITLLQSCRGSIRLVTDTMNALSPPAKSSTSTFNASHWAEGALACLHKLRDASQEVGMELYPPVDRSSLTYALEILKKEFGDFFMKCYSEGVAAELGLQEKVGVLTNKIETRWNTVQQLLLLLEDG